MFPTGTCSTPNEFKFKEFLLPISAEDFSTFSHYIFFKRNFTFTITKRNPQQLLNCRLQSKVDCVVLCSVLHYSGSVTQSLIGGRALLSVTLATLGGVYEPGWKEPCVKVGVKLLHSSCPPQAQTCLVALSDMRGFGGNGRAFTKAWLRFEGSGRL